MCIHFMHHIDCYLLRFLCFNPLQFSLPLCFFFLLCFFFPFFPTLSIMVRKSRAHKKTSTSSTPVFQSDKFRTLKHQENYEKLYIFRSVWAKHNLILDELDPEIRRNFESRGWLPLLEIEHPPPIVWILVLKPLCPLQ